MTKLSICIATYNRADIIGQTLDSIISQVREGVEIVVADGASTDTTPDLMRQYQSRCTQLRYYRLPVKGGVDRDYCHAVSFARGDYCWLLTDDDVLKPGAIDTILALLPRKYSLIVANAEIWDRSLVKRQEHKRLHLDADTFYEPSARELLFIEAASYLSFIGGVIIDRALWNERIKEPYIGTEFIHVGVIFQKDLPHGAFALAEPYIMIRSGNAQWSPRHFSIWMIKWPDLLWSFPDISESAKARVCPRNPWEDPLTLVLERAFGVYSLRGIQNAPQGAPYYTLAEGDCEDNSIGSRRLRQSVRCHVLYRDAFPGYFPVAQSQRQSLLLSAVFSKDSSVIQEG